MIVIDISMTFSKSDFLIQFQIAKRFCIYGRNAEIDLLIVLRWLREGYFVPSVVLKVLAFRLG